MRFRRGLSGMAAAATAVVLLGACSGSDGDKVNTAAKTPDVSTMDCGNPQIPMGEFRKRCDAAAPGAPQPTAKSPTSAPPSPDQTFGNAAIPSATPSGSSGAAAKVGDTIAVSGDGDEKFDATLVQIVDPAKAANEYSGPDDGNRLIAVQWRITNTGTATVDNPPAFDTKLVDANGQIFELSIGARAAGVEFPTSVQIPPGESRLGFVTYEVPKDTVIVKVEYEGGYGKPSAQWKLK